jgi:hypothetical protein
MIRMSCLLLASVLAGWLLQGCAFAATPPAEELIRQLGSPKFEEREQAERQLRDRGPVVLPALRKVRDHADPEVRRRVRALIHTIEISAALEPKRVTVDAVGQPLNAVLASIEKQTGFKVVLKKKDGEKPLTLALQAATFWEAIERIAQDTGLRVVMEPLEEGIQLKARGKRAPFVFLDGPFRLEATRFHEDRDIDFTAIGTDGEPGARDHVLTLSVSILAEPRYLLLHVEPAEVEAAPDEEGKALVLKNPAVQERAERLPQFENEIEHFFRKDYQHTGQVLLQRASARGKILRELRGHIPVLMVVEKKPVVVSEKVADAAGQKFRIGGDTLEITSVDKNDDSIRIEILVPEGHPQVRNRWDKRVYVEDDKGNRCEETGNGTREGGGRYSIILVFAAKGRGKAGPPQKLIVEEWLIVRHRIPFQFRRVPLP